MLGTKIYKNNFDESKYCQLAKWCNANNCTIEDKGDYYECVVVDVSDMEQQFKKDEVKNQIGKINLQLAELLGVSECAISVDGENEYDVFVDNELITMNETEFQNHFDELTNKRSELLQKYKELK